MIELFESIDFNMLEQTTEGNNVSKCAVTAFIHLFKHNPSVMKITEQNIVEVFQKDTGVKLLELKSFNPKYVKNKRHKMRKHDDKNKYEKI